MCDKNGTKMDSVNMNLLERTETFAESVGLDVCNVTVFLCRANAVYIQ